MASATETATDPRDVVIRLRVDRDEGKVTRYASAPESPPLRLILGRGAGRGMIDVVEPIELRTQRLRLRRWREEDREPFAALNADPKVMEYFPEPLTRAESDAMVDRIEANFEQQGFGLFAAEVIATGDFTGFVGLWPATFEAHFTPATEVGWRLAQEHWGRGYAAEAANAALDDGFDRLQLDEIVSFTAVTNERSWGLMKRLGMTHDPAEDFDHPVLPEGHRLRRHVLYRLDRVNR